MVSTEKALNYMWTCWKILGFYKTREYTLYQKLHLFITIFSINLVTSTTFIVRVFYMENMKQLLSNLPMNVTLIACFIKFATFLKMRVHLIDIDLLFAQLDRKAELEGKDKGLEDLVAFCKKVTLCVFILFQSIVSAAALNASFSNGQILLFDVWTPYDFRSSPFTYWATFLCQYFLFILLAIQNLTNDLSAPLFLIMLNSHLEILLDRIASIGWDQRKTQEQNYQSLTDAIEDHRIIVRIFDILQNTVGYTMFVQFITTAIVLSMEAFQYILFPPTLTELALILFYIIDVCLEILPCCYYSNNFMVITDRIVTAIYSSNVFDQTPKFKKTAIILMQMTQKSRVIVAGKIIPVTLATFMSVMKVSYSLLTVANRLR